MKNLKSSKCEVLLQQYSDQMYSATIKIVPGNHEPYPVIYDERRKVSCDAAGIEGDDNAVLYKVYDNVFYFRRNCEYRIEGKKLLVLGGALSVDQDMREPYESWWPEELLSPQEEQDLLSSTKEKTYDAVLAHTTPFLRLPDIFENQHFNDSGYPVDPTTQIYDRLIERIFYISKSDFTRTLSRMTAMEAGAYILDTVVITLYLC
jgi:hypothetical protein